MGLMWDSFGWDMGFGSRMSVEFRPNCTGFVKNSQEKDYYSCIIYKGQGCLKKNFTRVKENATAAGTNNPFLRHPTDNDACIRRLHGRQIGF